MKKLSSCGFVNTKANRREERSIPRTSLSNRRPKITRKTLAHGTITKPGARRRRAGTAGSWQTVSGQAVQCPRSIGRPVNSYGPRMFRPAGHAAVVMVDGDRVLVQRPHPPEAKPPVAFDKPPLPLYSQACFSNPSENSTTPPLTPVVRQADTPEYEVLVPQEELESSLISPPLANDDSARVDLEKPRAVTPVNPLYLLAKAAQFESVEEAMLQAEAFLDSLTGLFADPLVAHKRGKIEADWGGTEYNPSANQKPAPPLAEPSFSPILGRLLGMPETSVLQCLHIYSPETIQLAKRCHDLALAIERNKQKMKKLHQLHRHSRRQSCRTTTTTRPVQLRRRPQRQPNGYSDPNTCSLSNLSLVSSSYYYGENQTPMSTTRISASPLRVDTEVASVAVEQTSFSISAVEPRHWKDMSAAGLRAHSSNSRPRSSSLSKCPISRGRCRPGFTGSTRRRVSHTGDPNPRLHNSGLNQPCAKSDHHRQNLAGGNECDRVFSPELLLLPSTPPAAAGATAVPLLEQLTVHIETSHGDALEFSSPSAHLSIKTTDSVSPSTNDTTISSNYHRQPVQLHSKSPPSHLKDVAIWRNNNNNTNLDEETDSDYLHRPILELSHLANGLRILLIEGSHLRAGTLYFDDARDPQHSALTTPSCTISYARHCLIRLDQSERSESSPPPPPQPTHLSQHRLPTGKRRRMGEVQLQAWQVVQQAVLEVVPTMAEHIPPGTRVCGAWSTKLANCLFPGLISKPPADMPRRFRDGFLIDFDDGDQREVPLHQIRVLPDSFMNLHELKLPPSTSSIIEITTSTSTALVDDHHPLRPRCSTFTALMRDRRGPASQTPKRRKSHSYNRRDVEPEKCWIRKWLKGGKNYTDYTPNTTNDAQPAVTWKLCEKARRKYNGVHCYRSLVRNNDGLAVKPGDVVKFDSGRNEKVYLGEVKLICAAPPGANSPRVYASWFYFPDETGEDGKRVAHYEGAVFRTDHVDVNDANCIIDRVQVARNYSEFRLANQRRLDTDGEEIRPTYFVVGKFDPMMRRVLSWDPEFFNELKLNLC